MRQLERFYLRASHYAARSETCSAAKGKPSIAAIFLRRLVSLVRAAVCRLLIFELGDATLFIALTVSIDACCSIDETLTQAGTPGERESFPIVHRCVEKYW